MAPDREPRSHVRVGLDPAAGRTRPWDWQRDDPDELHPPRRDHAGPAER